MNTSPIKSTTKFTIELTSKELFVVQMALERFQDIDDGAYRKPTKAAGKLLGKLPDTGPNWKDIA
jgi:hypothetical protein